MEDKMTQDSKLFSDANELVLKHHHAMIQPEHLLLCMLKDKKVVKILTESGVKITELSNCCMRKWRIFLKTQVCLVKYVARNRSIAQCGATVRFSL